MRLKLKIKLKTNVAGREDALRRIDRPLADARIWLEEELAEGPGVTSCGPLSPDGEITMSYGTES